MEPAKAVPTKAVMARSITPTSIAIEEKDRNKNLNSNKRNKTIAYLDNPSDEKNEQKVWNLQYVYSNPRADGAS